MDTAYVAAGDGLYVLDGDGTATERLAGHRGEAVAADRRRPDRALVGTFESGLWRSEDGGENWARVGEEAIEPEAVTAVACSARDPDELWVGTEPSAVYRSTDGGDTWASTAALTDLPSSDRWSFPPRPETHHVRWIEPHPTDPKRWYVAIEAGALVRTDDGGETWTDHPAGARRDNHTLATHPEDPERVYAAAGDGYAESTDGGETWSYPQAGLDHRYVWGLAVDPGDPDRVLVSAASGAMAAHRRGEAYCYRRAGGRWERLDDRGIPGGEGTYRAVLTATDDGEFWACHGGGLFRSTDGGDSWERVDGGGAEAFGGGGPRGVAVVP
jgi:photosystem II stability/assembly factor-like uncharacterized protein